MGDVLLVSVECPHMPRRLPEGAGGGADGGHSGTAERAHIEETEGVEREVFGGRHVWV